jgi:hypothetical protein
LSPLVAARFRVLAYTSAEEMQLFVRQLLYAGSPSVTTPAPLPIVTLKLFVAEALGSELPGGWRGTIGGVIDQLVWTTGEKGV